MQTLKVLYIEPKLHAKTKALAAENSMTLSAYVEKAIKSFSVCHTCNCKKGEEK